MGCIDFWQKESETCRGSFLRDAILHSATLNGSGKVFLTIFIRLLNYQSLADLY
jgi:hypothetical protein